MKTKNREYIDELERSSASIAIGKDVNGCWYVRVMRGDGRLVAYRHCKSLLRALLLLNHKTYKKFMSFDEVDRKRAEDVEDGVARLFGWSGGPYSKRKQKPFDNSVTRALREKYERA